MISMPVFLVCMFVMGALAAGMVVLFSGQNDTVKLFVYGSLGSGHTETAVLKSFGAKDIGKAVLHHYEKIQVNNDGVMDGIRWGACKDAVFGHMYEIQRSKLAALDEFQGQDYKRITVVVSEGTACETFILVGDPHG